MRRAHGREQPPKLRVDVAREVQLAPRREFVLVVQAVALDDVDDARVRQDATPIPETLPLPYDLSENAYKSDRIDPAPA